MMVEEEGALVPEVLVEEALELVLVVEGMSSSG